MKKYQYSEYNLGYCSTVDAIYTYTGIKSFDENPLIAALPNPDLSIEEQTDNYSRSMPEYSHSNMAQIPTLQRCAMLGDLTDIRLPLPYQMDLEERFITSLRKSYKLRMNGTVNLGNERHEGLIANPLEGTPSLGFTLLGGSGSGKSSSVSTMLAHYPQVITHKNIFGTERFTQIVYIPISCYANSSFEALYASFGEAVDRALGVNCYETLISHAKGLAAKLHLVQKLVEIFAIGMIIIDEIQLMNFSRNAENTYESFMLLANKTKVAIGIIGTNDAYSKLFGNLRTARRTAPNLVASDRYCANVNFFKYIMTELFKHQFFDNYQMLNDDLIEVFYDETGGFIFLAVMLYGFVQYDYLHAEKKYKITAASVKRCAKKHFAAIKPLIANEKDGIELHNEFVKLSDTFKESVSAEKEAEITDKLIRRQTEQDRILLIDNAILAYKSFIGESNSTDTEIRSICEDILKTENITEPNRLAGEAYKTLSLKKKSKPKKTKAEALRFSIENTN